MTIELTEEMRAVARETYSYTDGHLAALNAVIRKVLAIVERDYRIEPCCNAELAPGLIVCKRRKHDGDPRHAYIMPSGSEVTWQ